MSFTHFCHTQFFYGLNRELTELYASIAIRGFAVGLVAIFEPIYLYLFFGNFIIKTLFFFAAIALGFGLLSPIGAKIISKIGVKHAMLASTPFLFLYFFCFGR